MNAARSIPHNGHAPARSARISGCIRHQNVAAGASVSAPAASAAGASFRRAAVDPSDDHVTLHRRQRMIVDARIDARPPARRRHAAFEHFFADRGDPRTHLLVGRERHRVRRVPRRMTRHALPIEQRLDVRPPRQRRRHTRMRADDAPHAGSSSARSPSARERHALRTRLSIQISQLSAARAPSPAAGHRRPNTSPR